MDYVFVIERNDLLTALFQSSKLFYFSCCLPLLKKMGPSEKNGIHQHRPASLSVSAHFHSLHIVISLRNCPDQYNLSLFKSTTIYLTYHHSMQHCLLAIHPEHIRIQYCSTLSGMDDFV